jgi:homocysteine S-methyltransferase
MSLSARSGDRGKRAYRASFLARRDGDMIQCKQEKVMAAVGAMSPQSIDVLYLAEGGPETEIMFRHGHKTCEFAMFELMDDRDAVRDTKDMYRRYFDVVAKHGLAALMAGFDYCASADWSEKFGSSREGLRHVRRPPTRLRAVARP